MGEYGPTIILVSFLVIAVTWSYYQQRFRKELDDELGQLERRKVEALERIAKALENPP